MRHVILAAAFLTLCTTGWAQEQAPSLGKTDVAVPWPEFRDLLRRVTPDTLKDTVRPRPPALYTLAEAQYTGKRTGPKEFTFEARMRVAVLADTPWVDVRLGQAPKALPGVTVNGAPAPLGLDESGQWRLVLKGPGVYDLRYQFVATVEEQNAQSTLRFPLARSAAAGLTITLDRPGYRVTANNVPLAPEGRGVYRGGLGLASEAVVAWQEEVSQVSVQNAMVLAQCDVAYGAGVGTLAIRSQIGLTVFHQEIRSFSLSMPAGIDVIDLSGPSLAAWEATDSAGLKIVRAYLKHSVRERAAFELTAEMAFADTCTRLQMPSYTLRGASRQEGTAAVGVMGNVEISALDNSANVLRRDKRELPPWFAGQSDLLYVYQYLSVPYRIEVGLERHDNVPVLNAVASTASVQSVVRADGKTITRVDAHVRNRGEQFLRLSWDTDWQLWSLYCNNQPARPAYDSARGELLVPLDRANDRTAETDVRLVYLSREGSFWPLGRRKVEYPSLNMPLQNVSGEVYLPQSVRPFGWSGVLNDRNLRERTPWFRVSVPSMPVGYDRVAGTGRAVHLMEAMAPPPPPAPSEEMLADEVQMEQRAEPEMAKQRARKDFAEDKKELAQEEEMVRLGALGLRAPSPAARPQPQVMQKFDMSQAVRGGMDAGVLSISVDMPTEGIPHPLRCVALGEGEKPSCAFWYRRAPESSPLWLRTLVVLLTLLAGAALTRCLWSGWRRRTVLWGVLLPLVVALLIQRYLAEPLNLNWVLVAPVLFFLWKAAVTVFRSTGRWLRSSREALVARATKRKAERAAREAAKAAARTADTQPSKEKK